MSSSSSLPHPPPPKRTIKAEPRPFLPYSSDANIAVSKDETWSDWRKRKTNGWGTFAMTKVSNQLLITRSTHSPSLGQSTPCSSDPRVRWFAGYLVV